MNPGDTISIVAPAGTVASREGFERGILRLENMGFHVRFSERIFNSYRYLAGDDKLRSEELMDAFEDPSVRAVMALRGGYGCSRLIPYISEKRMRPHPKIFTGFSDLTTLHMFFRRRFGWITFHGPMAATPSLRDMSTGQEKHLFSLWTDPDYRAVFDFDQLETWHPGVAEGVLVGGCLSIVVASLGTSYEINTEGKILFLEDQGEPPYRLDRMLTHLSLAGKLKNVSGILLGNFLDCDPTEGEHGGRLNSYTANDTLKEILTTLDVPILSGFPAGHDVNNWALPFGIRVRLNADARSIEFMDSAVR